MIGELMNEKSLIIVCNEKYLSYANYLVQLMGENDDDGDKVVGVKDNTYSASVWTEKHYENTQSKISSNTRVLFIGKTKLTKSQYKNMPSYFDKYGMHIGWLGKRAAMYVDRRIKDTEEYKDFIEFATTYNKDFKDTIMSKMKIVPDNFKVAAAGGIVSLASGIFTPLFLGGWKKMYDEIIDQQYTVLTIYMYLNHLQSFMDN